MTTVYGAWPRRSRLFIYGVADMGVTGERSEVSAHVADPVETGADRHRRSSCVRGGHLDTRPGSGGGDLADGVIVGSALVRLVLEADSADEAIERLRRRSRPFRAALDGARHRHQSTGNLMHLAYLGRHPCSEESPTDRNEQRPSAEIPKRPAREWGSGGMRQDVVDSVWWWPLLVHDITPPC